MNRVLPTMLAEFAHFNLPLHLLFIFSRIIINPLASLTAKLD